MSETEFTMMRPEEALAQAQHKWQAVLDAIAEQVKTYDGSYMCVDLRGDLQLPNDLGRQAIAAQCAKFGWVVEFHDDQRDCASVTIRPQQRPANVILSTPGKKFQIET